MTAAAEQIPTASIAVKDDPPCTKGRRGKRRRAFVSRSKWKARGYITHTRVDAASDEPSVFSLSPCIRKQISYRARLRAWHVCARARCYAANPTRSKTPRLTIGDLSPTQTHGYTGAARPIHARTRAHTAHHARSHTHAARAHTSLSNAARSLCSSCG